MLFIIIKKNVQNFLMSCYENSRITILDEYLQNFFLFNSKKLDEISKNFCEITRSITKT